MPKMCEYMDKDVLVVHFATSADIEAFTKKCAHERDCAKKGYTHEILETATGMQELTSHTTRLALI
jgi:hypothetical protein